MRIILTLFLPVIISTAKAKEVHYALNIDYKTVHFSGKAAQAMAINNSIPGPILTFNEGDTAVITVNNRTENQASIHWHGLLLPQEQDGVPYLTYFPIEAGASFVYQFDLTHAGTYWYHSHTRIDEQRGQYGAIVVHPKKKNQDAYDHDVVVQLSDWTDENPYDVLKNLKKDGDWYAYKKKSVISLQGYLENSSFDAWLTNRWQRMEGMDVSDVGYDAYLANGKTHLKLLPKAKAGDKVRVRLINSGASTYFDIQQNSGAFNIISADGVNVQPVKVSEFRIGMAETYDFIITLPESGGYEFSANNIDGTGGVSVQIGHGKPIVAPSPIRPNVFAKMQHSEHATHEANKKENNHHSTHQMNMNATTSNIQAQTNNHDAHHNMMNMPEQPEIKKLTYSMLKSRQPIKYEGALQEFELRLTGDMESYNWSFNNRPLSKADVIKIDRGKVVRFHFRNETMMHHPLHLHGHFFKVISGNGQYNVLKHTVDVPPLGNVTIEFSANEKKDWFFHCHNLYHAKTGMARIIRYSDYKGNPAFEQAKMSSNEIMDTDWYSRTDLRLFSSYSQALFRHSNTQSEIEISATKHFSSDNELTLDYHYKKSKWLRYFIGAERSDAENEILMGVKYVMPFNVEATLSVNHEGQIHVEAETEFQLTQSIALLLSATTDSEWETTLEYRTSPYWSIGFNANETSGIGVGVTATF